MHGQYEVLERIAVGGMAEIYLGVARGLEGFSRPVVIKKVRPRLSGDHRFVQMLIREAKITASLNHPNIVQILDLGQNDEHENFIVMEYVEGHDLRSVMDGAVARRRPIDLNLAIYIASEVCAGLHHAHRKTDAEGKPLRLIHRDVSPSNILISYAGEVKLTDFGIARYGRDVSVVGSLKGKVAYMSPEQARAGRIDHRTDIFSIGAILFELVLDRKLFLAESDAEMLEAVRRTQIPLPSTICPTIPLELEHLLLRALAPDPARRFQSAEEMQAALREFHFHHSTEQVGAKDLSALLRQLFPERRPTPAPAGQARFTVNTLAGFQAELDAARPPFFIDCPTSPGQPSRELLAEAKRSGERDSAFDPEVITSSVPPVAGSAFDPEVITSSVPPRAGSAFGPDVATSVVAPDADSAFGPDVITSVATPVVPLRVPLESVPTDPQRGRRGEAPDAALLRLVTELPIIVEEALEPVPSDELDGRSTDETAARRDLAATAPSLPRALAEVDEAATRASPPEGQWEDADELSTSRQVQLERHASPQPPLEEPFPDPPTPVEPSLALRLGPPPDTSALAAGPSGATLGGARPAPDAPGARAATGATLAEGSPAPAATSSSTPAATAASAPARRLPEPTAEVGPARRPRRRHRRQSWLLWLLIAALGLILGSAVAYVLLVLGDRQELSKEGSRTWAADSGHVATAGGRLDAGQGSSATRVDLDRAADLAPARAADLAPARAADLAPARAADLAPRPADAAQAQQLPPRPPPDRKPAPPDPDRKPGPARGKVVIKSEPWAYITVDGRKTGLTTSAKPFPLAAGTHRIELLNPSLGLRASFELQVRAGKLVRRFVQLEK